MLQISSANAEGSSCSFVTAGLKRCQNIFWINSYFKIEVRFCEILMQSRRQVLNCCNYDTAAKNKEKKTKENIWVWNTAYYSGWWCWFYYRYREVHSLCDLCDIYTQVTVPCFNEPFVLINTRLWTSTTTVSSRIYTKHLKSCLFCQAWPYDHQGNGTIHSFSSCCKQKFFPQRRVTQEVWAVLFLIYAIVLISLLLKIFVSILLIFDSVIFVGSYIHFSERQWRHMIDSGINKCHVDKATEIPKEEHISIHMQAILQQHCQMELSA